MTVIALFMAVAATAAPAADDAAAVSKLDIAYQAAVKRNDAEAMGRILDKDFALALGNGTMFSREQLLDSARTKLALYEQQDEMPGTQVVHVYGDTAVVTALLWLKGSRAGQPFERKLWFSDTYVRRPDGWHYAFGQASLPLAADAAAK
jgi:ketosteroid isomerase-like protein